MAQEGVPEFQVGQTVSHYRLLAKLGNGGMGVVYKAEDLVLERPVALKFLAAGRRGSASRQRLLEEARAASSLDHPHICTIFESGETPEGDLFLAMAFCEGETLQERIQGGPLELGEALDLAGQIASGLAHAHGRGVIHRDIKPSNVILTPSGVKIVDFGIAIRNGRPRLTREGSTLGTLHYMSPEQLLGKEVDARTDLWSLGVVLYELLTGGLPFLPENEPEYAVAVLTRRPEPVAARRPGLPSGVESLLGWLLTRDRAERCPAAEAALHGLRGLGAGASPAPVLPGEETTAAWVLKPSASPKATGSREELQVHPRVAEGFVGRRRELAVLREVLLGPRSTPDSPTVCALHGMPGVGKSFLADRFALDHADRFPGGSFRLVLDPRSPADPESLLEELADRLGVRGGADLTERVRERLRNPPSLLQIENVDSLAAEVAAGHLLRELRGAQALVTGRLHDLGLAFGWRQVPVTTLDEATALCQIWSELGWQPASGEEAAYRELVRDLGYLPLALHLASGHLRSGRSVAGFLRLLRKRRLALSPAERAEMVAGLPEGDRKVLATSFALSVDLFREEIGARHELLAGLKALGSAPPTGFGYSLGAAIAGLAEEDFEDLVAQSQKLGLLLPIPRQERPDGAWRIHPLVAESLRADTDPAAAFGRMTGWFVARLRDGAPGEEADQGRRWREVKVEVAALAYWLPQVPPGERYRVRQAASFYPPMNGPFHLWIEFCDAALQDLTDPQQRSDFLWTLATVAMRGGELERGLAAAEERLRIASQANDEFARAISLGLIGDLKEASGLLAEASALWESQLAILERLGEEREHALTLYRFVRVYRYQERFNEARELLQGRILPVFERIRDHRSRALALGSLADILQSQGDLDSALKIRESEELPIYERLGEARSKAITIGKVARILHARGQHAAALRLIQESEMPIYEQLGEGRELGVSLGRVAEILHSLGRTEEAITVRESEQLPLFERLGSDYDLSVAREGLALLYLDRRGPGDPRKAVDLLRLALEAAERLKLPAAERLRARIAEAAGAGSPPS